MMKMQRFVVFAIVLALVSMFASGLALELFSEELLVFDHDPSATLLEISSDLEDTAAFDLENELESEFDSHADVASEDEHSMIENQHELSTSADADLDVDLDAEVGAPLTSVDMSQPTWEFDAMFVASFQIPAAPNPVRMNVANNWGIHGLWQMCPHGPNPVCYELKHATVGAVANPKFSTPAAAGNVLYTAVHYNAHNGAARPVAGASRNDFDKVIKLNVNADPKTILAVHAAGTAAAVAAPGGAAAAAAAGNAAGIAASVGVRNSLAAIWNTRFTAMAGGNHIRFHEHEYANHGRYLPFAVDALDHNLRPVGALAAAPTFETQTKRFAQALTTGTSETIFNLCAANVPAGADRAHFNWIERTSTPSTFNPTSKISLHYVNPGGYVDCRVLVRVTVHPNSPLEVVVRV